MEESLAKVQIDASIYKQADLVRVSTLIYEFHILIFSVNIAVGHRRGRSKGPRYVHFREDGKDDSIKDVLAKPRTQVIYERHHFNNRKQEASERITTYVTELRMIDYTNRTRSYAIAWSSESETRRSRNGC